MKINVPVIRKTDLLLVGGSVSGLKMAVDAKKAGRSVFCVTPHPYFGEDLCAHFDFQSTKPDAWSSFFPDDRLRTPTQVKYALEHALMEEGIDFLFQMHPVAPLYDALGNMAGIIFADRSGFQAVEANVLLDATEYSLLARACKLPFTPFKPGIRKVIRYQLGGANGALVEKLPLAYPGQDRAYPVFRITESIDMKDNSPREFARIEAEMRLRSWHPEMAAGADAVIIDALNQVEPSYHVSKTVPLFLADRTSSEELIAFAGSCRPGSAVGAGIKPVVQDFELVRKDRFYRFGEFRTIEFDLDCFEAQEHYGVLVAGGGTAGAPAAIGAGRAGAKTLCIESLPELGGVSTMGRITVYYYGNRVGFTTELDRAIAALGPNPAFAADSGRCDVEWKKHYYLREVLKSGSEVRFGTMAIAAAVSGNRVCGVLTAGPFGIRLITADAVIDSTGNADVIAAAGGETTMASPKEPSVQGSGMSPITPGNSYLNTDYQFICDHDILDCTRSFVMGRAKFADRFDLTQIQNTRERRRIVGDRTLQPQDFYANRCYSDTINLASSNFDTHGYVVHPLFMLQPPTHDAHFAKVPFRALLPRGVENVLATGLSVSAHRDCMPLIRMQPDVQNQGYAVGVAAAMASKNKCSYREIDIRALQQHLVEKQILPPEILTEVDSIPGVPATDPHYELASIFINPEAEKETLIQAFAEDPENVRTAELLAFLGDGRGCSILKKALDSSDWDAGWNYRGMGQFGFSVSAVDCLLFAVTAAGGGGESVLKKLQSLYPDDAFSHFRAVCQALTVHPDPAAVPYLSAFLETPGMSGYAIQTLTDTVRANRRDDNDTTVRNSQLKEFYLARALNACDPGNGLAGKILTSYRKGLMGYFTMFA